MPSAARAPRQDPSGSRDRKSTRLNSSHSQTSYAVFCLKKKRPHPPSLHPRSPHDRSSLPEPAPPLLLTATAVLVPRLGSTDSVLHTTPADRWHGTVERD